VAGGRTAWRLILLPLSVEDIAEITRGWVVMVIVNGAFQHAIRKNVSKPGHPTNPKPKIKQPQWYRTPKRPARKTRHPK